MAEGPDGGRAWFVAIAALAINMVTAGIFRAQGLLFIAFMSQFNVDRRGASIPFSIRSTMRNLMAPVVGILGQKYGVPTVTVIGGILGTISAAVCFFAPNILWISIVWGAINGFSSALITVLPQVVIGQYFRKYRTTASGLAFSGGCTGSLFFPAILEIILETYGLNGAFFILAGLIMHCIPAAMLLKKPSWNLDNPKNDKREESIREHTSSQNLKTCDCDFPTGNSHDNKIEDKKRKSLTCNHYIPRARSNSLNPGNTLAIPIGLNNYRTNVIPNNTVIGVNNKIIKCYGENVSDIDLEYIKRKDDLVFQMFAMELTNIEISYRAILLEVEQKDLWHPEKHEILQEIENIYAHIQKSLEATQIPENATKVEDFPRKHRNMSLNGMLSVSKKSQSLRVVRKCFKTYKEKSLRLSKIKSAPNISNIYNELARKDYILSKLKLLCNSNEIRIISHLCQYNPKDVLKVLFQVRTLYKIYHDLESSEHCEGSGLSEPSPDCAETKVKVELNKEEELVNGSNSLSHHIKNAFKLYKNPIFLLICFTRVSFFVTFIPVMTTVVDFAMDRGLREADGKYVIGALSVGDLLGRLGLGWVTDRGYATFPRYMATVLLLLGGSCVSIPMMGSKWTLLPSISLFGLLQGSLFIRHPVLVAKYMKAHEQSISVGCMDFSAGIFCMFIPLYIGYFRDSLGSYNSIYYVNGIVATVTGLIWLFEPLIMKKNTSEHHT